MSTVSQPRTSLIACQVSAAGAAVGVTALARSRPSSAVSEWAVPTTRAPSRTRTLPKAEVTSPATNAPGWTVTSPASVMTSPFTEP